MNATLVGTLIVSLVNVCGRFLRAIEEACLTEEEPTDGQYIHVLCS